MFSTFKFMGGLLPGTVPGAPTSFGMVRGGSVTPTFFWNAPVSNGNRPITGYIVTLDGVGSRSVGLSTLGGYQGRTFGYEWTTGCTTCNYTGSVQAVNSIGTGSAAGGGQACAYSGYLISSGNCDGYTRYNIYTDGSCGTYRVNTESNSPSCGYNPCAGSPGYGTRLSTYCSGYTLMYSASDGCYGSYEQVQETNSPTCGYTNPCAGCPTGNSFYGCGDCSGQQTGGCDFEIRNHDGCCGETQQECAAYDCCD